MYSLGWKLSYDVTALVRSGIAAGRRADALSRFQGGSAHAIPQALTTTVRLNPVGLAYEPKAVMRAQPAHRHFTTAQNSEILGATGRCPGRFE